MEEARRVLERLERIGALRREGGDTGPLLRELRALLAEGEAWLAVEPTGTERAGRALAELARALDSGGAPGEGRRGEEVAV